MIPVKKENILQTVKANKGRFTRTQVKIAQYLMDHPDRAAFLTATQLAGEIGVSQPSIIRFVQTLGLGHYQLFQRAFQELIKSRMTSMERLSLSSTLRSIGKTPNGSADLDIILQEMNSLDLLARSFPSKDFDRLVEEIGYRRVIAVVGTRGGAALAQFLAYFLSKVKAQVWPITSGASIDYDRLVTLGREDLVIAIAFPRYPRETVALAEFTHGRGLDTVAITDQLASPLVENASFSLIIPITLSGMIDSYCAVFCLFNLIVTAVGRRNQKEAESLSRDFEVLAKEIGIFV